MKLKITRSMYQTSDWAAICLELGVNPMNVTEIEGDFTLATTVQQEIRGYITEDNPSTFLCDGCTFQSDDNCDDKACTANERDDGRAVVFVKYDGDHLWQCPNCPELPGYQAYKCKACGALRPTVKGK